tara:strand:+ start:504 stop:824 length:321 start_codon:yes stop_codon:yes gene_type:complete
LVAKAHILIIYIASISGVDFGELLRTFGASEGSVIGLVICGFVNWFWGQLFWTLSTWWWATLLSTRNCTMGLQERTKPLILGGVTLNLFVVDLEWGEGLPVKTNDS